MSTRFYPGQIDYIAQLNLLDDTTAVTNDVVGSSTVYPVFSTSGSSTGSLRCATTKMSFVPSTGVLSVTNLTLLGGYAVGDMLYASTTTTLSALAGVATGNVLRSGGVGVAPAWGKVTLTTDITGILPTANGGTGKTTNYVQWGVVYASATTGLSNTAAGTSGQVLRSNGAAAPTYATLDMTYLPDAAFKKSVKAMTVGNVGLTGTGTVDGIAVVANDRVLVAFQSAPANNGIYLVQSGAWTRATDADTIAELAGAIVNIDSGTTYGGRMFRTNLKTTDTLGTTACNWYEAISSNNVRTEPNTVSSLPAAASNAGMRSHVTDATVAASGNFGATVVGGGANVVPVFCNGTAWIIA